ncbi:hypothetical protein BC941DRAFT_253347 [Chlamydoabsidia padenii]|nr:hypothetical protein BC941DRAFT_253347 [Chlamydoabsidia padenii]
MSSIKYPLHSLVYMDDEAGLVLQQKGEENGNIWINGTVDMDDMDGDLRGLQLDDTGHYLAAWTNKDQLFIFCRRRPSQNHQLWNQLDHPHEKHARMTKEDDRDLVLDEDRLERWILSMVITRDQGLLTDMISAAAFITTNNSKSILIGLKNGGVQSYSLDKTEPQKPTNFGTFLVDQWHIWLPMSIVVFFFVASENQQASMLNH